MTHGTAVAVTAVLVIAGPLICVYVTAQAIRLVEFLRRKR